MRKTLALIAAILILTLSAGTPAGAQETDGGQTMRALLVSCDDFVSQTDTGSAAQTNVKLIRQTLEADQRGYSVIREESGTLSTVDAFRSAVEETFAQAREEDISVFYISTHGLYNVSRSNLTASLLLSDGTSEEQLDVLTMEEIFSHIKGTKVLILDACNAGAFIGKGLSDPAERAAFTGPDYKVLCSAGGSEESWYWRSKNNDRTEQRGASYFASIFSNGLSAGDGYPADDNRDGKITLAEAYQYVLGNYAASTPQVYPQEDGSFSLFEYDAGAKLDPTDALTDISFEDTVLTGPLSQVSFSFTVRREIKVIYQLVYFQNGVWRFQDAQVIKDETDGETLLAGRKNRSLTLALSDEDVETSGYIMLQIFSREADNKLWLQGSKLLCVQPVEGDLVMEVKTGQAFSPAAGQEMGVRVLHDAPCSLTVSVQNMQGETVDYLEYDLPTRPQHLVPEGSCLYWDGTLADGSLAPAGSYIIKARTNIGGKTYIAYSSPFMLLDRDGRAPAEG